MRTPFKVYLILPFQNEEFYDCSGRTYGSTLNVEKLNVKKVFFNIFTAIHFPLLVSTLIYLIALVLVFPGFRETVNILLIFVELLC